MKATETGRDNVSVAKEVSKDVAEVAVLTRGAFT